MAIPLPEALTMDRARAVLASLDAALRATPGPAVVDASALASFDTAAVAVLLELTRLARARGQTLSVRGAPQSLRDLVTLYGVDGLLPLAG